MLSLGTVIVQGGQVIIQPPEGGFGGVKGVRLSNYTGDVIILTNVNSEEPGQEYLLPFQQNVYHIENVRTPPRALGQSLGSSFPTATLLAEWSTEPLTDFPGTYPVALTQAGILGAASPKFNVVELAVPTGSTTIVPANPLRTSLTIFNDGSQAIEWNEADSGWGSNPQIAAGSGRTVDTTAAVYLRATAAGASSVQYYETTY